MQKEKINQGGNVGRSTACIKKKRSLRIWKAVKREQNKRNKSKKKREIKEKGWGKYCSQKHKKGKGCWEFEKLV